MSYLREANHVKLSFGYSFKATLKAEKHSNFRTSLYTTYWVVLPSYKAYNIWMET